MLADVTFGAWLRQQRRLLDLTQQELADQVGCARITLRRIEADELRPSKELAGLLLERLGIAQSERPAWLSFARGVSGLPSRPVVSFTPRSEPGNLPAQLTTFVGRQAEQTAIAQLLQKHRLVTLVGPGGVGKTRLSLQVGEQQRASFGDGVWLVELAALNDPGLIPQTVAAALGVNASPSVPITTALIHHLRTRNTLVILDNCEHLVDASAELADVLLKQCPGLCVLATSREALGILGEATYQVPPLQLPDAGQLLDVYRQSEAITLFEERAQLALASFRLTPENAPVVARICAHLGGIPLAIELAAVQVGAVSPAEIAAQLAQRLDVLAGGSRTAQPRQKTIRASIDWSWNLLTDNEQALLRRLAVFAGGWTMEAAESVCRDTAGEPVYDLLGQLVQKSLVRVEQRSRAETRYAFHEIVQEYAAEKLALAGEVEQLRQRHADYYRGRTEIAGTRLHGPKQAEWLERLFSDLPNLRTALTWAIENDVVAAQQLAANLAWFWWTRGLLNEGRDWLERIREATQPMLSTWHLLPPEQAAVVARFHFGVGLIAHYQNDFATARTMLEQSQEVFRTLDDQLGAAQAMILMATGYVWGGDFETADRLLADGVAWVRPHGEAWQLANALNSQGFALYMRGDSARARPLFQESLRWAREADDKQMMSWPLANLGSLEYQAGNLAPARALLEESLAIGRDLYDPITITWAMKELGHVARLQGDYARAAELYEAVLTDCRLLQMVNCIADTLQALGDVALATGERTAARHLLEESVALSRDHHAQNTLRTLRSFAELAAAEGEWPRAVHLLACLDAQLMGYGIHPSPVEQVDFERLLAAARGQLAAQEFETAWRAGQELSLDQAIALALAMPEADS